ncbi:MAG: TonB-dependent receptor [Cellvibrio sp.]|nr:TonB-dependent receptor [Cellvibrio sp.]
MTWDKSSLLMLILFSGSLQANSSSDLLDMTLEELMQIEITSASKVSQALKDIPAHVTLVTRQDIHRYGYTRLTDILRNLPGLYLEEDTEETFIGTRGTINGGILFLVNGIPQHPYVQKGLSTVETNRLNIPVAAIERIEFIRGPMSVIYGNNAFQGTLNIITQSTEHDQFRVTYDSQNGGDLFMRASGQLADAFVSVNLGASRQGGFTGSYREMMNDSQFAQLTPDNATSMKGNFERDLNSVDAQLNWQNWMMTMSYQANEYPIYPTLPPIRDNLLQLATWQSSLQYKSDLNNDWRTQTSLILSEDHYELADASFLSTSLTGYQKQQSSRLEFEQNWIYQSSEDQALMLGYRYQHLNDIHNNSVISLINPGDLISFHIHTDAIDLHDFFTQWQQALTDKWGLVVGLRYSQLPEYFRVNEFNPIASMLVGETKTKVNDRGLVNYRVALMYQFNEYHQLKLLHGTASQDVESILFSEPKQIQTSEIVHAYKQEPWLITQSLYVNETENLVRRQISFNNNIFMASVVNDGRWRTQGYEVNAEFHLTPNWHWSAATSLQKTDDYNSDLEIGYSPQTLIKLKTDYQYRLHTFAFYAHYVSERESDWRFVDTDNNNQPDTATRIGEAAESYWNLNANWLYRISENIDINVNISNLLDTEYRYPANEISALDSGLIAEGRVTSFSLTWEF